MDLASSLDSFGFEYFLHTIMFLIWIFYTYMYPILMLLMKRYYLKHVRGQPIEICNTNIVGIFLYFMKELQCVTTNVESRTRTEHIKYYITFVRVPKWLWNYLASPLSFKRHMITVYDLSLKRMTLNIGMT